MLASTGLCCAISAIGILALLAQNGAGRSNQYVVGSYRVQLQHNNAVLFVFKILYIVIWTWLLNKLCSAGYKDISWFLVLLPFILFFILVALLMLGNM